MKNYILSISVILLSALIISSNCLAGPIDFIDDIITARNWAKEQNKLIFVYVTNGDCTPCRKMTSQVFTEPRLFTYLNEHFINLQISVGLRVDYRQRFRFRRSPTLLIMNTSELEMWRNEGNINVNTLIRELERENGNRFHITEEIRNNLKDKEEDDLVNYMDSLKNTFGERAAITVTNYYFRSQKNKSSITPRQLFINYLPSLESEVVNSYVKKNKAGDLKNQQLKERLALHYLFQESDPASEIAQKIALAKLKKAKISSTKKLKTYLTAYQCLYMDRKLKGKGEKSPLYASGKLIEFYPDCNDLLLIKESTRIIATGLKDTDLFEQAVVSFTELAESTEQFFYYDILSIYSYVLGHKPKAIEYITKANSLSVADGIAYSPFLSEIRTLIDENN